MIANKKVAIANVKIIVQASSKNFFLKYIFCLFCFFTYKNYNIKAVNLKIVVL